MISLTCILIKKWKFFCSGVFITLLLFSAYDGQSQSHTFDTATNFWTSTTQHGWIKFGPVNTAGAHIYTDRDRFYFNKELNLITGKIAAYSTEDLTFSTGNVQRMTISSVGHVSIGASVVSNEQGWGRVFDVRGSGGSSKILATTSGAALRTGLYAHTSWHGGGGFVGTESDHSFHLLTDYKVRASITNGGSFGIGTTNPREIFQIKNSLSYHDGGHKILAFGWASGGGGVDLDAASYASEVRFDPVNGALRLGVSSTVTSSPITAMTISKDLNVCIGVTPTDAKLEVLGTIKSTEVIVDAYPWPDYVFEADYDLMSLSTLSQYIDEHGHLPEVPDAETVAKEGVALGEMNALLLKKIEELTLHQIAMMDELIRLKDQNNTLNRKIENLKIDK
jgi:hypothetical protein